MGSLPGDFVLMNLGRHLVISMYFYLLWCTERKIWVPEEERDEKHFPSGAWRGESKIHSNNRGLPGSQTSQYGE
jgi:hypothetical protein